MLLVLLSLLLVVAAVCHHQGRCGEVACVCVVGKHLLFVCAGMDGIGEDSAVVAVLLVLLSLLL